MKKILRLCSVLLLAASAYAGTITGQIQTATGGVLTNGTLTFTLSQPAVLSGTATIATTPASCYLSTAGNIVGNPDPLVAPVLSTNTASGTLAAGTYFVKITYNGAGGETIASPEASVVLSAQGTVIVTGPVLQPASVTGYKVYISSSTGTETLQTTVTGFGNYSQSVPLVGGSALPSSNTSVCTLLFSDQLIPTGTFYTVNLVNRNGSQIAGFPQTWCTFGGGAGTINVSNGAPTGNCGTNGVFYPTPIYANPQNGAQQSISGPIAFPGNVIGNTTVTGSTSFTNSTSPGVAINGTLPVSNAGAASNTAFTVAGTNARTSVWGIEPSIDFLTWDNSRYDFGGILTLQGSSTQGSADEFLMAIHNQIAVSNAPASYFKGALMLDTQTFDPFGVPPAGGSANTLVDYCHINTTTTGWCEGGVFVVQNDGNADGQLMGIEVDVNATGTASSTNVHCDSATNPKCKTALFLTNVGTVPGSWIIDTGANSAGWINGINVRAVNSGGVALGLPQNRMLGMDNGSGTYLDMLRNDASNNLIIGTGANAIAIQRGIFSFSGQLTAGNGLPVELSCANPCDLTGKTANISTTNIITAANAGLYRVSCYVIATTTGTTWTVPNCNILYTDVDANAAQTPTVAPQVSNPSVLTQGQFIINVKGGTAIQFNANPYASTGTAMQYALHIRLEQF